jgi:hypothetical protein
VKSDLFPFALEILVPFYLALTGLLLSWSSTHQLRLRHLEVPIIATI